MSVILLISLTLEFFVKVESLALVALTKALWWVVSPSPLVLYLHFALSPTLGLADEPGRLQILEIHTRALRENSLLSHDVDLKELAAQTKNFSGAEIEGLVRAAQSNAMNRFLKVTPPPPPLFLAPKERCFLFPLFRPLFYLYQNEKQTNETTALCTN